MRMIGIIERKASLSDIMIVNHFRIRTSFDKNPVILIVIIADIPERRMIQMMKIDAIPEIIDARTILHSQIMDEPVRKKNTIRDPMIITDPITSDIVSIAVDRYIRDIIEHHAVPGARQMVHQKQRLSRIESQEFIRTISAIAAPYNRRRTSQDRKRQMISIVRGYSILMIADPSSHISAIIAPPQPIRPPPIIPC